MDDVPSSLPKQRRGMHLYVALDAMVVGRVKRAAFDCRFTLREWCEWAIGEMARLDSTGVFRRKAKEYGPVPESVKPTDDGWKDHPQELTILERLHIIAEILEAKSIRAGAKEASMRYHKPGVRDGFSTGNLTALTSAYMKAKDWRILADKTKHPVKPRPYAPADNPDFAAYRDCVSNMVGGPKHGRQSRVFREIQWAFIRGDVVPGFGTWRDCWKDPRINPNRCAEPIPESCPEDFYPHGCSQRNMSRKIGGTPAALPKRKRKKRRY